MIGYSSVLLRVPGAVEVCSAVNAPPFAPLRNLAQQCWVCFKTHGGVSAAGRYRSSSEVHLKQNDLPQGRLLAVAAVVAGAALSRSAVLSASAPPFRHCCSSLLHPVNNSLVLAAYVPAAAAAAARATAVAGTVMCTLLERCWGAKRTGRSGRPG